MSVAIPKKQTMYPGSYCPDCEEETGVKCCLENCQRCDFWAVFYEDWEQLESNDRYLKAYLSPNKYGNC